jgi:glycosyltransferase involved in cell wall biosynthesis/SAM-dependent methyltransferase
MTASGSNVYEKVLEVAREGAAPLLAPVERDTLHIAVVIPPFRRGSGGHSTIYNLLTRLEERGHTVSTWLFDPVGLKADDGAALVRHQLREYFRPPRGPVFKGFDQWYGADVALATGWDTVFAVLRLPDCRARAYLVQDHEPEFFATSAESLWAAESYAHELHAIAASPWLRDLVRDRYGGTADVFDLGVDHAVYQPRPVQRRDDTIVFYARDVTPRRAVPLGMLALEELHRRHPGLRFVLFGDDRPLRTPFPYLHLGIASPEELSWAYSEATVGLSLSLTNYSLIPQEMMACGLPVVELAGRALEGVFGEDGPIELADADPVALADAIERLLHDRGLRERRAAEAIEFVAGRTWDHAADQLEAGLRGALRARLDAPAQPVCARAVAAERAEGSEATDRLYGALDTADVEAVLAAMEPGWREHYAAQPPVEQRRMVLQLGTYHRVPAVLSKTGLAPDQPPEDVHAMARGPQAGGGDLYYPDMLADCLRRVGASMDDVRRGLDWGCSSGRVVRVMAAAWPAAQWHGADPNTAAILWAQEHLPAVRFLHSPQDPPLPYEDGSFDLVFAISIWSHYAEGAALRWLEEMRRVVAPDGRLILTTHGWHAVEQDAHHSARTPHQIDDIRRELARRGFWFRPEFGAGGDWGVKHPEWGTAFFTTEWLARHATPQWAIEDFAVGQNANYQDVYVLRRGA